MVCWLNRLPAAVFALGITMSGGAADPPRPEVGILGEDFTIDGVPTYQGRQWRGHRIEGLLFNSRMVQATFDDENPETRVFWAYPDTGEYDADRNTDEFIEAMQSWREAGLLAVTLNLQGGGPIYTRPVPYYRYINSAYDPQGNLKPAYMDRLERILDRAAELGMAVILGLAYFAVDQRYVETPDAARAMTDELVDWLAKRNYRHVLIEIANERTHIRTRTGDVEALELMDRMRERSARAYGDGFTLLCATSLGGGQMHSDEHMRAMDYILMHGNGCGPERHVRMIEEIREHAAFRANPRPILFNESHTDVSALWACAENHASFGYYDQGTNNYHDGYQTPPVNWSINTDDKRRFFELLSGIVTGEARDLPASPVHIRGFEGLPEDGVVTGRIEVRAAIDERHAVREVRFFVGDELVNTERRHPYYLGGDERGEPHGFDTTGLAPGRHTLRAVVVSLGGSISEEAVDFTVAPR